jgi:hypothetical protein
MSVTISRRTYVISAAGLVAAVATWLTARFLLNAGAEFPAVFVGDVVEMLLVAVAGIVCVRTALGFPRGDAVRRQWLLIGTGVLLYAMGDAAWSYYEVVLRTEGPYPGAPDLFYVLQYVFLGAGILSAAFAYRRVIDIRKPLVGALLMTLGLFAALYALLLHGMVTDSEIGMAEKAISIFYPAADVLLGLFPALFILLVARGLGRGAFGWPWYPAAFGLAIVAISDATYSWLQAADAYATGHIVDAGWMVGYVLIAVGALVARDVFAPAAVRTTGEPARERAA